MDAVILAAGRGSRLGRFTEVIPKALSYLPGGRTLIEEHIERLEALKINSVCIVTGHLGSDVEMYVKRRYPDCQLVKQHAEAGTAADGILAVETEISDDFIVVHGDHFFSENPFPALMEKHERGSITFMLETPGDSMSLGYGERCLLSQHTGRVQYPLDTSTARPSRSDAKEAVVVDGCMALPTRIFEDIHLARQADPECVEMNQVFGHAAKTGIVMRGVAVPGWWANINDEETYLRVVQRLRDPGGE